MSTPNVVPLHDRVILRPEDPDEVTRGGLFLPATAREENNIATVVSVGPGRLEDGKRVPLDVVAGERVLYAKYSAIELRVDGERLLVLRETEVLAKLPPR